MSPTRQPQQPPPPPVPGEAVPRLPLHGPTNLALTHRESIGWHLHDEHQLIHPSQGVLQIFTTAGTWVVPPLRGVWVPAGVAHAHQASGPTRMRTLAFPPGPGPPFTDRPTVLAVSPLLREVIISLTDEEPAPARTARQRRTLEQVALDELRRVDAMPLLLPAPADDRLRAVAALLHADPADPRSLSDLGAAVGAAERTLSRLFRRELGMSFPQWRTQLRLHHSLILLAAGTTVTTTATACGYAHTSAFIEAFRQAFGTTPGRYHRPPPRQTTEDAAMDSPAEE
ncbi:AraC family transcriptional regulator [Actinacidiphila paucisporea]|uniref:HTH-type transcriptional regulator RipA n=1 Tax=Actinacidiphila paucisporea TaxID=310782 RepID=A0A1M6WZH0_9ACTN|nr:helix-turn-helix transcriptional regulator [Actinacidiphila paucisporea]SHK99162.1 transcriptional regulator, AraC family [Actinacidiphila paucisporea]